MVSLAPGRWEGPCPSSDDPSGCFASVTAGVDHRRRRGGPGDLVRRPRVRRLPGVLPGRRHRPVPGGGRADARDPRVEGGHPRRGGQLAGARRRPCSRSSPRPRRCNAFGSLNRAFVTVVAATMVVTLLTGITFLVIGTFKLGNLIRFVPYPVVGGFLAGTGWLLLKGGIYVASGVEVHLGTIGPMFGWETLQHWLPALAFGVILFLAVRLVKKPLVIPIVLAVGLALFAIGMLVTGSSIDDARTGLWMLGPYRSGWLWQPWTFRALTGADWSAVLGQAAGIATVVFVAVIGVLFNVSGTEIVLHRDLDTNRELRDAGLLERRLRRARRHPGLPRAQPDGARGAHERRRAGRGARRRARPARRRRVRRRGDRADPAHDRRRRAGVPRPHLHRRVGLGQAADAAEGRVRRRPGDPRGDHRQGVPARRGDRLGDGRRPVRGQLRPDRAGARGRVRGHLPQQRRPAARRASGPADDGRAGPDPARERVRVLRVGERPARADPQAGGDGAPAVPADGPPAGDGRGRLGGDVLRQGDPPRGGERVRARARGGLGSGAQAARTGRGRRRRRGRPVRAGPGSRPAAVRGRPAGGGPGRAALGRRSGRRSRQPAAGPADLPRARIARGGHRADPPGRAARRRVRAGVGPA